ncbi:MAG: NAD(+) diphosphatase [Tahibacter sp.]
MSTSIRSRANVFAALALERMAERRDDSEWLVDRAQAPATRCIVLRADGRALADAQRRTLCQVHASSLEIHEQKNGPAYLGDANGIAWFAHAAASDQEEDLAQRHNARWVDLRSAGLSFSAFEAGLFAYARALLFWHSRVRFCGACGSPTRLASAGHKAVCTNTDCALEHFPRTDPAIIVIVSWRDACLLGRQPGWPEGRYSTLAGFVEPGETLEDTVRREVFEEAGVSVAECDYHSSQPWPFPASLMLGFTARAENPTINVGAELAEARWFSVDDIVSGLRERSLVLPPPLSVSHRLIEHWLFEAAGLDLQSLMHDEPWLPQKT